MTPAVRRAADIAAAQWLRAREAARRHPVRAALVLPGLLLLYLLVLVPLTPGTDDLRKAKSEVPTRVLSDDGVELAAFKRLNREWVTLDRISPHVVNALIATEDHRFYQHHGIDLRRTAAAVLSTLSGQRQGGSTITQQLARNLYPDEIGRAPSLHRKAKEAITALKIEAVYTKNEILETYLNTVPFLYNAFGIEMAARTYFDKPARQLDVLEAATLIGMLKGTSYYNPVLNPERALARRNIVLAQMARHGKLGGAKLETAAEAGAAARFRTPGGAARSGAARRATDPAMADRLGRPQRLQHVRGRPRGAHHHPLEDAADRHPGGGASGGAVAVARERRPQAGRGSAGVAGRVPGAGPAQRPRPRLGRQPRLRARAVRPRLPGAAPAGLHVQALRLRRGVRCRASPHRTPSSTSP